MNKGRKVNREMLKPLQIFRFSTAYAYHGLHGSGSTVVTMTIKVNQWENGHFDTRRSETPKITKPNIKFGLND